MTGSVVCALADRSLDAEVAAALSERGEWTLVRRCVDLTEVRAVARAGTADVAVISAEHRALDARVIDDLRAHGMRVVGVARDEAAERRLRQWRVDVVVSGAVDAQAILTALAEAVLSEPVVDAALPTESATAVDSAGRLVVVWGPPGAPGRSTVALNLAAEWALAGSSTLLVDADDRVGSLAQMAGVLDDHAGVLAAARAANQAGLDLPALARLAPQVSDRLRILTGTARPIRTPPPPTALEQVWSVARLIADVVVVDAGAADVAEPGVGASALAAADQVLVVGLPDPVGLARLVTAVQELRATESTAELHVLLNRMRRQEFRAGELNKALALAGVVADRTWQVPDEIAAVDRALAAGRALASVAPRSSMRQSLRTLRAGLTGATAAPRRWGWRLAAPG